MLKEKLTIEQQSEILNELFGFRFENLDVNDNELTASLKLRNEVGYSFYQIKGNNQFDFSTLEGIFAYAVHRAKIQGYEDCQRDVRKLLGIKD